MDLPLVLFLTLTGLALADSLSAGTLGLPAVMLAQPRVRAASVLTYLAVIAAFYWLVGVLLRAGALAVVDGLAGSVPERVVDVAQLVVGVVLFGVSFLLDGPVARRRAARRTAPTRWARWRSTLVGPEPRLGAVALVGLGAALLEVATMLPYLAAVGILAANEVSLGGSVVVLLGYSVVMVLPALVLLLLRMVFARAVEPLLAGISGWFARRGNDLAAWAVGIVGFLLASDALSRLSESWGG
jgi:cytochrome c biogenesis protein CcdA